MPNNIINKMISLREQTDNLISYKRTSGYKADHLAKILNRFCNLADGWSPGLTTVTKEVAEKWAYMTPEESPANQRIRMYAVQELSKYLISSGIPSYLYPKQKWVESQFKPYIFSDDELARFFTACDNTKTPHLIRADVVSLVFRLIYSCGLRASEATNLIVRDVDLVQGTILITDAKFNKERLLPVHNSLLTRMKKYHIKVHTFSGPDTPYFLHKRGGTYSSYSPPSLYSAFRDRLWAADISHGGKGNGPRLHDLRHTFAVHSLRKAVKNGEDINSMLKYLSVYLGHSNVLSSQRYLRLTADMYPDIVYRMEKNFDVLPDEEDGCETD